MPGFRAVKIELPFFVYIADGDGIGVAVIPGQRQDAGSSPPQNGDAVLFGQFLPLSPHFTKHDSLHIGNLFPPV